MDSLDRQQSFPSISTDISDHQDENIKEPRYDILDKGLQEMETPQGELIQLMEEVKQKNKEKEVKEKEATSYSLMEEIMTD